MKTRQVKYVAALIASLSLASLQAEEINLGTLGTPDVDDIEYPDEEPHSEREVALGKVLFFETKLSRRNNQSCATCHNPELGFSDGMAKGFGSDGTKLGRNAPHVYNLAWTSTLMWDGRAPSLEEQALGPIQSGVEMQMTADEVMKRLSAVEFYKTEFAAVYEDGMTFANLGKAIAAFERTIISDNSPFDQYIAGNESAMSPSAVRGLRLFVGKANCVACHDGPNFTDDSFHNIGLGDGDIGRYEFVNDKSLLGAFKTPGLRNIVFSAPYMHDGSIGTLEEVVEHYNKGGRTRENISPLVQPLNLNQQEKADLVAFMAALTDPVMIERPIMPK